MQKEATLYEKLENNQVACSACAHRCKIKPKNRGICHTRENRDGKLFSLVYGKACVFNVDPIEKKPLMHFLSNTKTLSIGTVGCNFSCDFCQNWNLSQDNKKMEGIVGSDLSPEGIVKIAKKFNLPSISYTYNEPAIFSEYAADTAKLAKLEGINNIYVTNGYLTKESRALILPYLDAANIDLKSFDDSFYKTFCGAKLEPVLETIEHFFNTNVHIEITTLVVPNENDTKKNFERIANYISGLSKDIPWHISRFYPAHKMKDLSPTDLKSLELAKKIGQNAGIKNIYIGNV